MAVEPRLTKHRYEDENNDPILTANGGYELFHYVYEPPGYDKTVFIQAQLHGNEKDCRLTLYRMMEILLTERDTKGYAAWRRIYNRCRLIVIPCASPYGNDNSSMNVPYEGSQYGININRNYDYNQQYGITSGVGGYAPWEMVEAQHTRDVINRYGARNIDYALDFHDGGTVQQHYWIGFTADSPVRPHIKGFVSYLLDKHGVAPEDAIIDYVKESVDTGVAAFWYGKTMGITGSTNEWMGGIFGYDFSSAHLTHSMEVRSNMLFIALANDLRGWQVKEPEGADYFHFDYPKAFTRDTLRMEGAAAETKVSDADIYARWDALQVANPTLITKSASLGNNADGMAVHTYTFGDGANKVLYVGGVMRYGGTHKIDEYAIYQLVEYLCDDGIVAQSAFLTDLRENYTIIVLPCIDNVAGNGSDAQRASGLNNAALSRQRWVIDGTNKTVPAANANGTGNHGVQIVKALVDANTDLKCIVSGGEILSGYGGNTPYYATVFQTHFVVPRNMAFDQAAYKTHLETNRSEHVVVENTQGFTFGDYAYDQFGIPVYFVQLQVSDRYAEFGSDLTITATEYMHGNYEAGRRMANIVNLFVA